MVWKEVYASSSFIVYDFEAVLAPLNEHPTDDLTYITKHIPISVADHWTLSKEPVYSEKPETFNWTINWGPDRKARSNSGRYFKTTSTSFRFSNSSRRGERIIEEMG